MSSSETADLEELISSAYKDGKVTRGILDALARKDRQLPSDIAKELRAYRISLADCEERESRLFLRGKLWIPNDPTTASDNCSTPPRPPCRGPPG
jgi:hypothetical protein